MVSIPFDFLNNLPTITNNADGSVTVNGVTYKDGQIVEDTPIIEDTPIVDETTQGLLDTIAGNNDYLASQGYTYDPRTGSWRAPDPDDSSSNDDTSSTDGSSSNDDSSAITV